MYEVIEARMPRSVSGKVGPAPLGLRPDLADWSGVGHQARGVLRHPGCQVIQVEEPAIHGIAGTEPGTMLDVYFCVQAFNREVAGLCDKTEV